MQMTHLKITGASDDLIEIEGEVVTEFSWYPQDTSERAIIAVSDGTVLACWHDQDKLWRFSVLAEGTSKIHKTEGCVADNKHDAIDLADPYPVFTWVVFGTKYAIAKKQDAR